MTKKKVAMLVSNPCNPDYRVVKQAESLARNGYEVRVFCVWRRGLGAPVYEERNRVTYIRRPWIPLQFLRRILFGKRTYPQVPAVDRDRHRRLTGKK